LRRRNRDRKIRSLQATLGAVLYAKPLRVPSEDDWVARVRSIAAGDGAALHELYARTHRLVFTMIMRITSNQDAAQALTLDVYEDLGRQASRYEHAGGTVLGWIMNQARSRAIEWLRLQAHQKRYDRNPDAALLPIDTPDFRDLLLVKDRSRAFRNALSTLAPQEREAIEAAYFSELPHAEVAARLNQPAEAIKARMRSGLHRLRRALAEEAKWPMSAAMEANACHQAELVCTHALGAVAPGESAAIEAHLGSCWHCRRELEALRPVVDSFIAWPTDVLRPPASLQTRLAQRIGAQTGTAVAAGAGRDKPQWEHVAPGIECQLLAADAERHMVSMLVRLAPGGEYPPHTHAGVEELHLLEGELWIDDRKLYPGDYNRAEPATADKRVWSATGCTCVLVTSTNDVLS
jgi:RNA polymerase sigma factor (sigma-70 family)